MQEKNIIVDDPIYGRTTITEPVLIDVMLSAAMRRLQGVLQHGITGLISVTRATTRYEHSVGVMLLVRRLGGPVAEQIAALLHDVSHTAFSHVIDHVFGAPDSQSYHDEMKEQYVAGTDLPAVLADYGYDWHDFLDETTFPLLEQPAPALCADRLDYFLRDSPDLGLATAGDVAFALSHLVVHDGRIVVDNLEAARWLGYIYIAADEASWANFWEVGLYELTAGAIRRGLAVGAITLEDIWSTDDAAWAKLQAAGDAELQRQLRLISPRTQFVWDAARPDFSVSTKLRTIDPDVLLDGMVRPLSTLDPHFAHHRASYLSSKSGPWPFRVVPPSGSES
ncbi:MAG: HD domain-containing protein [Chloroflexi bacterium]|nr:HD domain-containing protein [Chloroflexota bacterium]MCI0578930.1 HD domain-containing protein [Chloroflexota bacterium]MCI0646867.1 HD domain-containing protein [Chloroflexota bacterium]MCI0725860.1 HD domain-containing protein [Chloroflexota bacterium]